MRGDDSVKQVSIDFKVISGMFTCSTSVVSFLTHALHSRAGIYSPVFTAHDAQRVYARRQIMLLTTMASRLNIKSLKLTSTVRRKRKQRERDITFLA